MSLVLAWYISKYHLQHLTFNSISSVIFIKLHLLHKIQLWSQKWWSQRINQQAIVSDCYFSLTLLGLCVKPGSREPAMFFSVARKWLKSMSSVYLVRLTSPDWIYWFSHLYFLFQSNGEHSVGAEYSSKTFTSPLLCHFIPMLPSQGTKMSESRHSHPSRR